MKDFRLTDWLPTTRNGVAGMGLCRRYPVLRRCLRGPSLVRRGCHRARFGSRRLPGGDCSPTGLAR